MGQWRKDYIQLAGGTWKRRFVNPWEPYVIPSDWSVLFGEDGKPIFMKNPPVNDAKAFTGSTERTFDEFKFLGGTGRRWRLYGYECPTLRVRTDAEAKKIIEALGDIKRAEAEQFEVMSKPLFTGIQSTSPAQELSQVSSDLLKISSRLTGEQQGLLLKMAELLAGGK